MRGARRRSVKPARAGLAALGAGPTLVEGGPAGGEDQPHHVQ